MAKEYQRITADNAEELTRKASVFSSEWTLRFVYTAYDPGHPGKTYVHVGILEREKPAKSETKKVR